MASPLLRALRRPASDPSFFVFLVTVVLCLLRARDLPSLDVAAAGTTLSIGPADIGLAATAVLAVLRLRARRSLPSPWLLGAAVAFALLIVASAIPNGATALTAAGKLAELAALTIGAAAFLDTRDRLAALAELIVAYTVVAVCWGAVGFVGAGGRQGSFLGEHDLAAVSTMALAVGLARLHAGAGRLGLAAVVAIAAGSLGIMLGASLASLIGLYLAIAAIVALAAARRAIRRSGRACHARHRRGRHGRDAVAPQRRPRLHPGVVRPGAGDARPVRGELEPAPHLRLRRRPRLPRPPGARHRLAGRAARPRTTREYLPDARERFSDQPPSYFPPADGTFIPQQAYDQVLFQLGLVGAALLFAIAALGLAVAVRAGVAVAAGRRCQGSGVSAAELARRDRRCTVGRSALRRAHR